MTATNLRMNIAIVALAAWASWPAAAEPGPAPAERPAAEAARPMRLAILGDSLTQPYRITHPAKDGVSTPLNWVEVLAQAKRVDLGTFAGELDNGRGPGYPGVYAFAGCATSDVLERRWHRAAARRAAAGEVDAVALWVGHDDFKAYYTDLMSDGLAKVGEAEVQATADRMIANYGRILDEMIKDGATRIFVLTLLDWSTAPIVKKLVPSVTKQMAITRIVQRANAALRESCLAHGVTVVDIGHFYGQWLLERRKAGLSIAGTAIDCNACEDQPRALQLADGIHPGSVGSALLADYIAQDIARALRLLCAPLSQTEIAALAGLPAAAKGEDGAQGSDRKP